MACWDGRREMVGLCVSFALACGPSVADADGDGDGDGSGESGGESGGEESGGDASDSGDTGVVDGPECSPADGSLSLFFDVGNEGGDGSFDCVVLEPEAGQAIRLACDELEPFDVSINITVEPSLALGVAIGTNLTLDLVATYGVWEQPTPSWSVFARDGQSGELVFAAIDSYDLDWTESLAPLTLQPIDAACVSRADDTNCRSTERLMWDAQHDGASAVVGDGTRSTVGGYTVHLQRAADGSLLECVDLETDFYEMLIVRTG